MGQGDQGIGHRDRVARSSRRHIGTLVGGLFFLASIGLFVHPFLAGFSYDPAIVWVLAVCSILLAPITNWIFGEALVQTWSWTPPGPATLSAGGWSRVARGFAFTAIFFSASLWLLLMAMGRSDEAGFSRDALISYALLSLSALVTTLFAISAMTDLLERLRFGRMPLHLVRHPLSPGEQLNASLEVCKPVAGLNAVKARLACIKVVYRHKSGIGPGPGRGGGRSTITIDETVLWSREAMFAASESVGGKRVKINIEIPPGLPFSSAPEAPLVGKIGREYHRWELRIACEMEGVDLQREYPIVIQASGGNTRASRAS